MLVKEKNRLQLQSSLYLRQHADSPIDWYPWGKEAFLKAKIEDKPLLLSVGFPSSQDCQAMAKESFSNKTIAAFINENFVSIKVDREEFPEVDAYYQAALSAFGQTGGWPLTMFLKSNAESFWGGTYFPPEEKKGVPSFHTILKAIVHIYKNDKKRVESNAEGITAILNRRYKNQAGHLIPKETIKEAAKHLLSKMDPLNGGLAITPKFPNVPLLKLLWAVWKDTGDEDYFRAVDLTLVRLCQGGVYDHIGGGFLRYSTDEKWFIPHFEKTLHDNALLIDLLTELWQDTRNPLYEARIRESIDWIQREMMALKATPSKPVAMSCDADLALRSNCFASSQGPVPTAQNQTDKDCFSHYYLWSEEEINRILGMQAGDFKAVYSVGKRGNWKKSNILHRSQNLKMFEADKEAHFGKMRDVLLAHRLNRLKPSWDDRLLLNLNAMMIHALAKASRVFRDDSWLIMARDAFSEINDIILDRGDLFHSWQHGKITSSALLDDYVWFARASLSLYEVTWEPTQLGITESILERTEELFYDHDGGGCFQNQMDKQEEQPNLPIRIKSIEDNSVPNANAILLGLTSRLFYLTGNKRYAALSDRLEIAFAGHVYENYFPLCGYLSEVLYRRDPVHIVIVGYRADQKVKQMLEQVFNFSIPQKTVQVIEPDLIANHELPPHHPASKLSLVEGKPAAYICRRERISPPITQILGLRNSLKLIAMVMKKYG